MRKIIISTIFMALAIMPVMALDISLSYSGAGLRIITARDVPEGFGRGLPMGPSSLRFMEDSLWVVDSVAGRLVEFDASGKMLRTVAVNDGARLVIADFAFSTDAEKKLEAIWAIGSEETAMVKIDLDGKAISSFTTDLGKPCQLEILPGKRLAVFDEAIPAVVVYDETGKKLWQQECFGKGFSVNANGDITFLSRRKDMLVLSQRIDSTGRVEELRELTISHESHPSILLCRDNGELLLGFHSLSEADGGYAFNIARFSKTGKDMASVTTAFPAAFLNRLLLEQGNKLFLVNYLEENQQQFLRLKDFESTLVKEAAKG